MNDRCLLGVLFVIFFYSCSNFSSNSKIEKFTLEYSKDEDYFNSAENIFRRNYAVSSGTEYSDSIRKINFDEAEIAKISEYLNKYSIINLPSEFSCGIFPIKDPNFINLKINQGTEIKEIQFKFDKMETKLDCPKAKQLLNFTKILDSILYNKSEIKNLPPTNLYYE